jgi:hypothetical protein
MAGQGVARFQEFEELPKDLGPSLLAETRVVLKLVRTSQSKECERRGRCSSDRLLLKKRCLDDAIFCS